MPIKDYPKGDQKMRDAMLKQYGKERGERIWYATMNKRKKQATKGKTKWQS